MARRLQSPKTGIRSASGGRNRRTRPVAMASQKRSKDRQGVALIVVSIVAVLGIGAAMAALQPEPYDEATLCPYTPAPERAMVLVDRSDALIGPQRVRQLIEAAEARLPVHGRLSLYEIGPSGGPIGDALFDLCNPGRGADVSPIYRNPRRVQAFYEEQFKGPLDAVLTEITRPIDAPTSPIVESIADLFRRAQDGSGAAAVRMIVVSDFLQNTGAYGSAYRNGPRLKPDAAAALLWDAKGTGAAEFQAIVMQRPRLASVQERLRREFWEPIFAEAGVIADWR